MSTHSGFPVQREVYQSRMSLREDADTTQYRAVSGLAIFGLLAGLLSLLGLVTPLLWALAIVALLVNLKALKRIEANAPALLGRKAALVGLAVSAVALCAAPADWIVYRVFLRGEARQVAGMWFDYLRENQPHKAHQLGLRPTTREPLDDKLWESYREGGEGRPVFEQFLHTPEVSTLLALGDKATVRYYATESQWTEADHDRVYQTFAVTFPDSDGLKTFFVGLMLERMVHAPTGHAYWQVARTFGGVKPKALGGNGSPPKI
jgi:hypothetical protein